MARDIAKLDASKAFQARDVSELERERAEFVEEIRGSHGDKIQTAEVHGRPCASQLPIHPIGRGAMIALKGSKGRPCGSSAV
jgi:hypothetical protein